ncbi:PP2C family protein-serine/threonine phosphatase [Allokutzneria oryzae]|uniref:PP2C family protein-serine/threonine phosphatase n=1 Tax=Allokutzneria oryzae TaxID=1378989 RepID=A0ABV6A860_9PSEU
MTSELRGQDRVELDLGAVAGVSDRGLRHHRNEDGMAVRRVTRSAEVIAVVCDGVSTSDRPDEASRTASTTAADVLLEARDSGEDPITATRRAITAAAEAVAALERPKEESETGRPPACTFVSAVVTDETITIGWVGDSRAYWLTAPAEKSACMTLDDAWAAQMVAAGHLTEEEAHNHRMAHVLMAWLGANAGEIRPHVVTFRPQGPGVVVVCTDGLWNYVPSAEELAEITLSDSLDSPLDAARVLTQRALDDGGRDNITVVVVPFPQGHAGQRP